MLLKAVILIYIAFLAFLAVYLLTRLHKQFIIFNVEANQSLQKLLTVVAIALLAVAVGGIFIVFLLPKQYNFITLFASVIVIFFFTLRLTKYLNK